MPTNRISVVCTNPLSMRLRVTAELSIGEWKEILSNVDKVPYYFQHRELMRAIECAVSAIEKREEVSYGEPDAR